MTLSADSLLRPTQIGFRMPHPDGDDQVQQLWVDYEEFLNAFCEKSNNSEVAASLFSMSIGTVVGNLLTKYQEETVQKEKPLTLEKMVASADTTTKDSTPFATREALFRALRIILEAEEDSYRQGDGGGVAEEPLTRHSRVGHVTNFTSCMMEAFNLTQKERVLAVAIIGEKVISGQFVTIGKNIDD